MELTLANAILNLLGLGFRSFTRDTGEDFFASVQFSPKFFSTKWDSLWMKMKIPKTSGAKVPCNKIVYGDEKRMQIEEVMNRLGMVGWLAESGENSSLVSEDLVRLFDEEEPSLEEIKETFGVFDANKDGFIDAIELQIVLCNLGFKEGCNLEECKRMIRSCDSDGDGLIDIHDFVKFMEKCLC